MTRRRTLRSGFTVVELLITLFVAAAFIGTGYQLFNLVIIDGGETRSEAAASNVAYDYLRRYTHTATNPCTASTPLVEAPITIENVAQPKVSVNVSCPQAATPSLSRVEVTIAYGPANKSHAVKYATFVDMSRGSQ